MRYIFAPGRDLSVGYGSQYDVRLDHPGDARWPVSDLLLRFIGTHWVVIDRGRSGIFVDGARVSAVDIRDGQTITIGDPHNGPRLTFQTGAATGPPPPTHSPAGPAYPSSHPVERTPHTSPTESATQHIHTGSAAQGMRTEATQRIPPPPRSTFDRATRPIRLPPSGSPPARGPMRPATPAGPPQSPAQAQPKARGLVERMTDATRKLLPARPDTGSGELAPWTNRLPLKPGARTIGVAAYELGLAVEGCELICDVSFTARPGSLIAIVGPSHTRNRALIGMLAGTRPHTSGVLTVDGHDVAAEPESMRSRIGVVPLDNRIHPRLTVEQTVSYAAEMRLPPDTSPDNRTRVINQVLDELELTPHRKSRVAKVAPEVRRCASMAIELITRPSLLVVDEPSAGLDPEQENHVMAMLRRQADLGCVVVVATTSLAHLNMCDQVLLLTPAGSLAFAGPPVHLESAMGTSSWTDVFSQVSTDPQGAHHAFLQRQRASVSTTPPSVAPPERLPTKLTFGRQVRLVARRQVRLLLAGRPYILFLMLLPFALAALTLLIPGDSGLDRAGPTATNPHEAIEILAALNIAAVLMGTALTVRDLVGERRIFRREQAVGLSASAYLTGKIVVFGVAAAIQAAILTAIVVIAKGQPVHDAVLLRNPGVELYASVAATAIVSAILGLALSTLGHTQREVVPLAVPVILASLLFAGGLLPLVGRWGFEQLSWLVPAHWGFAATAATVDLRRVDALATHREVWAHYVGWWSFDMVMLVVFGVLCAGVVRYRLRPPGDGTRDSSVHGEQQELGNGDR
ncbi:ABC transporter permease [Mycobacterium basiliense]|nr:ABC transporter permease [Mycobacterium basiliense]